MSSDKKTIQDWMHEWFLYHLESEEAAEEIVQRATDTPLFGDWLKTAELSPTTRKPLEELFGPTEEAESALEIAHRVSEDELCRAYADAAAEEWARRVLRQMTVDKLKPTDPHPKAICIKIEQAIQGEFERVGQETIDDLRGRFCSD